MIVPVIIHYNIIFLWNYFTFLKWDYYVSSVHIKNESVRDLGEKFRAHIFCTYLSFIKNVIAVNRKSLMIIKYNLHILRNYDRNI